MPWSASYWQANSKSKTGESTHYGDN